MSGGPTLPPIISSVAKLRHRSDDDPTILSSRSLVDWNFGTNLQGSLTDDPVAGATVIRLDALPPFGVHPGELDLGAGNAINTGYTLATGSTFTPLDLTQDLVIGANASDEIDATFDGVIVAGTGAVFWDLLSVSSGRFFGGGIAEGGWPSLKCPASVTSYKNARAWMVLTAQDVVSGAATFRWGYWIPTGTGATLLANDDPTQGHFRSRLFNMGNISPVGGTNTSGPPVTPPTAGTITLRGTTVRNTTDANATEVSGSFTPTAGHEIYAITFLHIAGSTKATVTMAMSDTFGDAGGAHTSWTKIAGASDAETDPNGTDCDGITFWRRTIGTGPSAGTVTATCNAGTVHRVFALVVVEGNGFTEAPSQSNFTTAANVTALTNTLGPVGATSTVIGAVFNTGVGSPVAPTAPTNGGTWTPVVLDVMPTSNNAYGVAYLTAGTPTQVNWTGLLSGTSPSIASYAVIDPSGSTSPAPGVETFTVADKSGATADQTWVDMTI